MSLSIIPGAGKPIIDYTIQVTRQLESEGRHLEAEVVGTICCTTAAIVDLPGMLYETYRRTMENEQEPE